MKILKDLYLGEKASKEKSDILKKIRKKYWVPGVYVISLSSNETDLFDIIPEFFLIQKYYTEGSNLKIVGIGKGKDETMSLMVRILQDVKSASGNYDVSSFFADNKFE